MINKRELAVIIAISIILAFTISLIRSWQAFLYALAMIFLIIVVNILAKKITAYYLSSEIEVKLWEIQRYGFKPQRHFKKPIALGAFLPIIVTVLSAGYALWLACFTFDIKAKTYRAAKKKGLYKFSEITEDNVALIASIGILANLAFAIIAYLINIPELARLNVYYAAFNMIPLGALDGNKIFMGSLNQWIVVGILTLTALFYAIVLV